MSRLKIGELAQAAQVPRDTIRYYERTGLLSPPERTSSGYRLYQQADVDRMRFIRAAQSLDFTLAETQSLLSLQANDQARASDILAVTLAKLNQAELKVARLNRVREILQKLADACPQDAATDACPILEYLSRGEQEKTDTTPTKQVGVGEGNHTTQTKGEIA
jgi:DNA-binding transcriptional MerR regulator